MDAYLEDYSYAEMAKKDIQDLKDDAEARVDHDENKKNQYDFALWINAENTGHLMKWNAPWSTGYPGWHLECSVMSQKYLGDEFDIHAGGKDHIFPHHPNERAQAFAASGKGQARYWLHNEFINIGGEKMSKSKGNFHTVRELLEKGYSGDAIRLYLVSAHYRSDTDFTEEGIAKAEKELRRIRAAWHKSEFFSGDELKERSETVRREFEQAMDDDLNTAQAKQVLMQFVSEINSALAEGEGVHGDARSTLQELFKVLGVEVVFDGTVRETDLAQALVDAREVLRANESYDAADRIRDALREAGFEIEDTDDGVHFYRA
jgi:cysteinyl-tRNA synthetase